jgi:hypothetical protein
MHARHRPMHDQRDAWGGWPVFFGAAIAAAIFAFVVVPAAQWVNARYPAPVQTPRAPVYQCPAPSIDETLVITVRLIENRLVTSCIPVVGQGTYKAQRP